MAGVILSATVPYPRLPPTFLSVDKNAVNVNELSALLASTGQNCTQFPSLRQNGLPTLAAEPSKLRLALHNSTVVVSVHIRGGSIPGQDYMQTSEEIFTSEYTPPFLRNSALFNHKKRLIAFGRATSDRALTASIYDLAVAPSLQRQGFGRQVLRRIIRELLRQGITDIAALTTPEQRPFFIACGFGEDELESTTMMYLRSGSPDSDENIKQFGRKYLLVPSAINMLDMVSSRQQK